MIGPLSASERIARFWLCMARMDRLGQFRRSFWQGCDGSIRCGRSGDVAQMLDDLGIEARLIP